MKLRRLVLIIGGLVVLAVLLCVGGSLLSGAGAAMKSAMGTSAAMLTPTAEASPGVVTVRARGEVVPAMWADLYFEQSGPVAEWFVAEGETVEAGAALGRLAVLNAAELERAVEQAEIALQEAQLRRDRLEKPPDEAEIRQAEHAVAQAEAALETARLNLAALRSSPLLNETQKDAQQAYDDARKRYEDRKAEYARGEIDYWFVDQAKKRFEEAQKELTRVRQQADLQLNSATAEVTRAEQAHQEALDRLAKLKEGPSPLDVQSALLELEAAQLNLEQARAKLEATTLKAPFAGTVVKLHLRPGDWANVGAPALTLADLSTLRVETTDLDEWSAAQVRVGSPVTITFNAFDDKTLAGHVTGIDLRGEKLPAGDVVYRAIITLDEPDPQIRWGMTVRISIPIEQKMEGEDEGGN